MSAEPHTSLRGRLFAAFALTGAATALLTALVGTALIHRRNDVQARRGLEREASNLVSVLPSAGARVRVLAARPGVGGVQRLTLLRRRAVLAALPPEALASPGVSTGAFDVAGNRMLYAVAGPLAGRLVLVRTAALASGEIAPLITGVLLAAAAGALVAALWSLGLARWLARPLRELAEASERLPASSGEPLHVPVRGPTEVARLARAFNGMSGELAAARSAQRRFLLSVSHELKTPLTSIKGYAEGLQDGAVDPSAAGTVIAGESERLEALIGDLLDLARLDRREFTVDPQPVELGELADGVRERYAGRARSAGVELEVVRAEPSQALADPDRLVQALSNLVDNALRATPRGGRVTIEARPGSVAVRDTGPGLRPEDLPHAFERFYLHERSPRRDGSGLGLAIVAELARAMGGEARVQSEHGAGARFELTLPVPANVG
jgi:two-component system, OmpR family, sensor kinase